ncbi:MAG: laccase domain-containing protein [Alcaligenaceae bacterium]|nr:laccase domain-containing protein [Alcaligenaceae bacterium]
MSILQQYPKPFAAYDEVQGLPIISGPKVSGLGYFTTTAKSGRKTAASNSGDSDAFTEAGFNLGLSTGADVSLVLANRAYLTERLPSEPLWISQVHGASVFDADDWQAGDEIAIADASVTTKAGRVLAIQTADCMPVVMLGSDAKVLGVAHAGWRSLLLGVIENTIEVMQRKHGGAISYVWIGPSIGAAAFEVGVEVREAFREFNPVYEKFFTAKKNTPDKYSANLVGIANHKLCKLMDSHKVAKDCQIYFSGLCSYSLSDWFYSYRRNPETGRLATVAYLI